jgi:type I site-specific restriction endonuclease
LFALHALIPELCSRSKCYKLDAFFGQEDRASDIFDKEVSAVIPGIFKGVNATVFVCGATGSGKTYTMQVRIPFLASACNVFDELFSL